MNDSISSPYARACRLGSVALAIATLASQSEAATATASLTVSATVVASCTVSVFAGSDLTFGSYAPSGVNATSPVDVNATLVTNCTTGAPGYITLGAGLYSVGGNEASPVRKMASGTNRLNYQIYIDGGRSTVWGNTSTTGVSITGNGSDQTSTVSARIPAGQTSPPGSYTDTVAVTLTY